MAEPNTTLPESHPVQLTGVERDTALLNVAVFAAKLAADPYWAEHWRSYFASVARLADSFLTDGTEADNGTDLA